MYEPRRARCRCLFLAQSVSLPGARPCPELGVEPTCRLDARTSQVDSTRTLGSLVLAELFVPRPGQCEVFWMGVGSCRLV
jgi:hypothetical protein